MGLNIESLPRTKWNPGGMTVWIFFHLSHSQRTSKAGFFSPFTFTALCVSGSNSIFFFSLDFDRCLKYTFWDKAAYV